MYDQDERQQLQKIAQQSILHGLKKGSPLVVDPQTYTAHLQESRATFVTLNLNHTLRGCIGTLSAHQPLVCDIAHNAYSAAFSDPRFPSMTEAEYPLLHYHISILSESAPMTFSSEQELIDQLRPGVDGLILQDGFHRGTFLPSVWEQLPEREDFLNHLKQKAGLASNHWSTTVQISRYTVESF